MKPRPTSLQGSTLLFVLVLVAILSLVFVGWIEIMTARTNLTETISYSVQRRISYLNSRAMLQAYMNLVAINASSGQLSPAVMAEGANSSWGSLEIAPWQNVTAGWQNPGEPPNAFLPGDGAYSPPLQAFFGQTLSLAEEAATQSAIRPMIGILRTRSWGSLPIPTQSIAGNVVKAPGDAPLWYSSDGSGNVTVNLATLPFGELGISATTNLTLAGDPNPDGFPILLRLDLQSSSALSNLNSSGTNLRPLTIALRQPIAAPRFNWTFGAGQTWLGEAIFVDAPVQFSNGNNYQGFLLTNSSVLPANLPRRIIRPNGWNEIYLSPPAP